MSGPLSEALFTAPLSVSSLVQSSLYVRGHISIVIPSYSTTTSKASYLVLYRSQQYYPSLPTLEAPHGRRVISITHAYRSLTNVAYTYQHRTTIAPLDDWYL
jgi:hypothetical protein